MISIVVPVYHVEKYIGACIDSVVAQTSTDWELILVADDTEDPSIEVCKRYADTDSRIRVVPHSNTGVSRARNAGIAAAAGEYIMFLDGDDWLEADTLERMLEKLLAEDADACFCRKYFKNNEVLAMAIPRVDKMPAETAILRHLHGGFALSACLALTRFDKVRDIYFNEKIHTLEDWEFNFRQLTHLERVAILDKPLYHYRTVAGSASKSSLNERKLSCFLIPEAVNAYIAQKNLPYKKEAKYVPIFLINHMLVILANGKYEKGPAKALCGQARKHLAYALTGKGVPLRQRIYTLMAAITPRLFCLAYKIKYRGGNNG